jgi:Arc/MetJ-type ribon-helix-helix transcriptional regulator
MVRTQIQLTNELAADIKDAARREHVSMAEMIRRAVARLLASAPKAGADDRYARALSAAGRFRSGARDLSTHHDAAFAEASRK